MDAAERPNPDHYHDLGAVQRAAWDMLVKGANSRKVAFHQAFVATVAADGTPAVRTVVLRRADRAAGIVRFHTDRRSRKFHELTANPSCEIVFYDHGAKIQLRVRGTTHLHAEDDVTAAVWSGMRDMSKACYRQPKGPGVTLGEPAGAEHEPLPDGEGYANFVVVAVTVEALEWLYLAAPGHRRAVIDASGARWLAP